MKPIVEAELEENPDLDDVEIDAGCTTRCTDSDRLRHLLMQPSHLRGGRSLQDPEVAATETGEEEDPCREQML